MSLSAAACRSRCDVPRRTVHSTHSGPELRGHVRVQESPPLRVVVNDNEALKNSRLIAIHLALLTLRWMEYWKRNVADYDSAMIALAVVAISSERWTRAELEPELRDLSRPLAPEYLNRCNLSSIAAATGLNRETTRRKVNALIAQGILAKDRDGVVGFAPGHGQKARTIELVRKQLDSLSRTVDDLVRTEVLDLVA